MPTPVQLGYPLLPRGAGSIRWAKGAWEGRWFEQDGSRPTLRDTDYYKVYEELLGRWKRKQLGQYVAPAEMTIRDLVESYIERRIAYRKWKPATINAYRRIAKNYIYPYIGDVRLLAADPPRLQHWVDRLAGKLQPRSVNAATSLLSAALNHAVGLTIIPSNPCHHIDHPSPEKVMHTTWTVAEIGRVDAALQDEPMWLSLYRLALSTGMRPGELRALTWGDVHFDEGYVLVRRTVASDADGRISVSGSPKSGDARHVPLTAAPRAALLRWQATQVRRSLDPDLDWIFPGPNHKPMHRSAWYARHRRLITEAAVSEITFHELRHTSATLEMDVKTPTKVLSERLGHKDPAFTMRIYQHVDTELQTDAAEALDRRLFGTKPARKRSKRQAI